MSNRPPDPQDEETLNQSEFERLASLYARWKAPYEICLIIAPDGSRSWQLVEH